MTNTILHFILGSPDGQKEPNGRRLLVQPFGSESEKRELLLEKVNLPCQKHKASGVISKCSRCTTCLQKSTAFHFPQDNFPSSSGVSSSEFSICKIQFLLPESATGAEPASQTEGARSEELQTVKPATQTEGAPSEELQTVKPATKTVAARSVKLQTVEPRAQTLHLAVEKGIQFAEFEVNLQADGTSELRSLMFDCKRDRTLLDFANFLGNIGSLSDSRTNLANVRDIYAEMLVPNIGTDGSYFGCFKDKSQLLLDFWGPDLPDEEKGSSQSLPKSAVTYCQMRLMKFPDKPSAKGSVAGRLRQQYEAKQKKVLRALKKLSPDMILKLDKLEIKLESSCQQSSAGYLISIANSLAATEEATSDVVDVDRKQLKILLQRSAAIVRGRVEEKLLMEEILQGCLLTKAWFAFMMAVWNRIQPLELDQERERKEFNLCFSRDSSVKIPFPAFYTW